MIINGKSNIHALLNIIEENLYGNFNIDSIANAGYVSSMQLYRDFYALTGHTVKEYIRKRRMSCALSLLVYSDLSLADIAYKCGYSSQQAFCRSVKSATGRTPLEYKAERDHFYFPPFAYKNGRQVTVKTEKIPETIKLKFFHGCMRGIENRSIEYLTSIFPEYSGKIYGRNGKQTANRFCYELYIEHSGCIPQELINSIFEDFEIIPEYKSVFAKTQCKNNEEDITSAWDYLYMDWLKTSMFEQSDTPYFEEYIIKDGCAKKLILYLPVRRRGDYHRIYIRNCKENLFLISRKNGRDSEENSSQTVMNFISSQYPHLINNTMKFYVSSDSSERVCGINIKASLSLSADNNGLEILHVPAGDYAILEGNCCGNNLVYENILRAWVKYMGFETTRRSDCFAIYETNGSFREKDIKTKVYLEIKDVKN